jgi:hypothetical protein
MTADGVDARQYRVEPVIGTMAMPVDIVGETCESSGERRGDDMDPRSCIEHSSCGDGQVVNLGHALLTACSSQHARAARSSRGR